MRIGVDVGGTKIEALALDSYGNELVRRRIDTPRGDYAGTVEAIGGLVEALERDAGRSATVGLGIPGAISPATGLVKNANSTWLIGRALINDLSIRLRREIRAENDANCFARSEARDGAGRGDRVVFGVILGTGVGGGIAVDGSVLVGANAIAGEWGHNPLPWPAPSEMPGTACYCGRAGCIETFLSGPALARDYREQSGRTADSKEIVVRAEAGDAAAERCLASYEHRLARALAGVVNLLDPDVIVLGGGMSNVGRLYENVPARWGRFIFSDTVRTRLVPPAHGDSSGVRGAAWLWPA